MLSHLFHIVMLFTEESITPGFNVGKLGLIGGFLFFFSASFGQMDGLVDNRSKEFLKYRLIALAAPVVILVLSGLSFLFDLPLSAQITNAVICVMIAMSAYYNLKHVFIPDVDMGILKCIRSYNLLSLILMIFSVLNLYSVDLKLDVFSLIVAAIISIIYILILPMLDRGIKKWTI